jgi:hypothetical protein
MTTLLLPENASDAIDVTDAGMNTELISDELANTLAPIDVQPYGITKQVAAVPERA